jgi:hypothetical protein
MSDRDTDLAALVARAKQATCGYTHRELLQSIVNALAKLDPTPENPMVTLARALVRSEVVEVVIKELLVKEIADLKQQLTEAKANQNSALTTLLSWVREQKPSLATAHEYSELVSHGLRQAFAQTENHILRTMDTK